MTRLGRHGVGLAVVLRHVGVHDRHNVGTDGGREDGRQGSLASLQEENEHQGQLRYSWGLKSTSNGNLLYNCWMGGGAAVVTIKASHLLALEVVNGNDGTRSHDVCFCERRRVYRCLKGPVMEHSAGR